LYVEGIYKTNNNNNNNIYFAKGQVNQKDKSPSNLATILRATKEKNKTKLPNYPVNLKYGLRVTQGDLE